MEVRVGVVAGTLHASLDTGPPALAPPGHVQQGAIRAQAIVDKLDSANFPRDGYAGSAHIFASTHALGADDTYTRWDADFLGVRSIGPHTLQAAIKAGGAIGDDRLPRYDLFSWGGFLQQSGYPTGALLGERLTFGRLVYTYRVREARFFEGVYVGASLEAGPRRRAARARQPDRHADLDRGASSPPTRRSDRSTSATAGRATATAARTCTSAGRDRATAC